MSSDNSFNTIKKLPETVKQFIGLIFLTLVIILFFAILNKIFGGEDELVRKMKLEEERIAKNES
jgi:hypothetical protein